MITLPQIRQSLQQPQARTTAPGAERAEDAETTVA
jgi:hypothetical protein